MLTSAELDPAQSVRLFENCKSERRDREDAVRCMCHIGCLEELGDSEKFCGSHLRTGKRKL